MIQPEQRFGKMFHGQTRTVDTIDDVLLVLELFSFLRQFSVQLDVGADGADGCPEFVAGVSEKLPLTVYRLLHRGETVSDKLRHFIQLRIGKIRHRIREFVVVEGMSPGAIFLLE